jgi:hypothetical protein
MVQQSVLDGLTFAEGSEWLSRYIEYHTSVRCLIFQKIEGLNVFGWNNTPQCSNNVKLDFLGNIKVQAHDKHNPLQALSQNCGKRQLALFCLSDRPLLCPPVVRIKQLGYYWKDFHDI